MDKFNIEVFAKGAQQELQSREGASTAAAAIEKLASMLTEELEYIVRDDKGIRLSIMELKKLAAQENVR
ncbi:MULTISPECIES: hypothetical protein [unclassified Beijerinckia]|uniref:hypothetical protein n=1 Tax=unclassified Beijerinckia TaxID=2638183 RepID=UPI0008992096|nr:MULTISPECIES: hypothetical protein [unclassified Beijerinckia]MDH7795911.1 hypothetical protein [Beijerinckia sp. GAS462]SEC21836.1 hypothetical protein SAMN05443249_2190 [Beijerinckia sp. 28-YEA-48]